MSARARVGSRSGSEFEGSRRGGNCAAAFWPLVLFVTICCIGSRPARGQALDVAPVTLTLVPGQRAASIAITNRGDQKTSIQTRPFAWDQVEGTDRLTATTAIAVSPPLFDLGPGETQLVRLVLRGPAPAGEGVYRLLLDQLPGPAAAGTVRVALRISLPVFVRPSLAAAPVLNWRVERTGDDLALLCRNSGERHAHITRVALTGVPEGVRLRRSGAAYVLAHAQQWWPLEDPGRVVKTGAVVRVEAETDEGRVDAAVSVSETP